MKMSKKDMSKIICHNLLKNNLVDKSQETYLISSVMDSLKEIDNSNKKTEQELSVSTDKSKDQILKEIFVTFKKEMEQRIKSETALLTKEQIHDDKALYKRLQALSESIICLENEVKYALGMDIADELDVSEFESGNATKDISDDIEL